MIDTCRLKQTKYSCLKWKRRFFDTPHIFHQNLFFMLRGDRQQNTSLLFTPKTKTLDTVVVFYYRRWRISETNIELIVNTLGVGCFYMECTRHSSTERRKNWVRDITHTYYLSSVLKWVYYLSTILTTLQKQPTTWTRVLTWNFWKLCFGWLHFCYEFLTLKLMWEDLAFRVEMYRRTFRFSWRTRRTNEPQLQEMEMQRKLQYFGHVIRAQNLCAHTRRKIPQKMERTRRRRRRRATT